MKYAVVESGGKQYIAREGETIWPMVKRMYRFVWNERFTHPELLNGLYGIAQCTVAEHAPSRDRFWAG